MTGRNTAPGIPTKPSGATEKGALSFKGKLDDGVLLTGTPTVTAAAVEPYVTDPPDLPSVLTITSYSVTEVGKEIDNRNVAPGRAVTWSAAGGTNGQIYKFTITCATDADEVKVGYCYLK